MPFKKRCNCNEDMLLIVDINNLDMKEKKNKNLWVLVHVLHNRRRDLVE